MPLGVAPIVGAIGEMIRFFPMISDISQLHRNFVTQRAGRYLQPWQPPMAILRPLNISETLICAALVITFIAAQIFVAGPSVLYGRTCWIDESITQMLVNDPDASHSVDAIRHGVETNPPVYHLIARGVVRAVQQFSPVAVRVTLRIFSTLCVAGAMVAAYALLRNSFGPWPSAIGLLTVWPHPQLIEQLFEARFYAPLLAASLALAVSLQWRPSTRSGTAGRAVSVAIAASLVCTLHYFGIIILAVLVTAAVWIDTGSWRQRAMRAAPVLVGVVALLPFLSFIHTQAAGLTDTTFLVQFSPRSARDFLVEVFYPLPILLLLAGWCAGQLLRQTMQVPPYSWIGRMRATVPLLSLAAVPLVILAFSALVQSALRPRYPLVATFAIAPVAAMLASTLRPRMLCAVAAPLMVMGFMQMFGTARMHSQVQKITAVQSVLARQDAPAVPIIFADRGDAIELADLAPDLFSRILVIDGRSSESMQISQPRLYELEMMDKARAYYPTPPLVPAKKLSEFDQVRIIANSDDLFRILLEAPMRRISDNLYAPVR